MLCKNFDFSLVINGGSVKEYEHNGHTFIEGKNGSDFALRFKNNTHKRCMAVITVDGKSILDGAPGSIDDSGGYVVEPYSNITIPGWRLDNNNVAKFVFANPEESYAAQGDDPEAINNVGIIGCAVFYEQEYLNPYWMNNQHLKGIYPSGMRTGGTPISNTPDIWYGGINTSFSNMNHVSIEASCGTDNASAVVNDASIGNLGTAFGHSAGHAVKEITFNKTKEPETVFTLYYDSRAGLEARGVSFKPITHICPSPFPASKGRGCKPPKNWDPGITSK